MYDEIRLIVIDRAAELTNQKILSDPRIVWSDTTTLTPVQLDGGYQIFMRNNDFWATDLVKLITGIDRLFSSKFPDEEFTLTCLTFAEKPQLRERIDQHFTAAYNKVMDADITEALVDEFTGDDDDDDDDDDDGDLDMDSAWYQFGEYPGGLDDDEDEDDDDDDRPNHRQYDTSRVIRNAKHPKRDIKRHRIIIARKKDYDRDRKMIKAFLKEFMPGKEKWIKRYRSEIAGRWIRAMAVKEKEAKAREKEFRATAKKAKARRCVRSLGVVANQVLNNRQPSAFYDPNK